MLRFTTGGENYARQRFEFLLLADSLENIEPAQLRHHQIEEHEVDLLAVVDYVERLLAVVSERYPKWSLLELHLDDAANVGLIIGD
jgi:hypothetical protein